MAINPNPSLSHHDKFGAVLAFPNGVTVPVVALVDVNGSAARTIDNGDGTSTVGSVAGNGPQIPLTYLSTAQAAANPGTSFSTSLMSSLAIDLTVTAFTGGSTPSITFFVDRFAADGNWYRVWTSSAINTATTTLSVNIGPLTTGTNIVTAVLTQTARFGWSFAGTPTSVTFSASVVGR